MYLNGKILSSIKCLSDFRIDFLSQIAHIFKKATYTVNENILFESEKGQELFFIEAGRVSLFHRLSHTFIGDIRVTSVAY